MSKSHDLPDEEPPAMPETPIEDLIPMTQIPMTYEGDPNAAKTRQWANDQLSKTYARIDELREELRIVESALRLKDPIQNTALKLDTAVRRRPPKTELSYQESKDLYEVRQELLAKLASLETHRDALERDFLPPEDAEGMRRARADIEAVPEEDLAAGGYAEIREPSAMAHYPRRLLEKYYLYTGVWHLAQAAKWIAQKTRLTTILKELGAAAERGTRWIGQQALAAPKEERKALPSAQEESDRQMREAMGFIRRLHSDINVGPLGYDESAIAFHQTTRHLRGLLPGLEAAGDPATMPLIRLRTEADFLEEALTVAHEFIGSYHGQHPDADWLEGASKRLRRRLDEVRAALTKREGPNDGALAQQMLTNMGSLVEHLSRMSDVDDTPTVGLREQSRVLKEDVDTFRAFMDKYPGRPEAATLEGLHRAIQWRLDDVNAELAKRGESKDSPESN